MNTKLFLLHALSPLHAGTGRGVGMIDMPIAREKVTGIPYIPGSSIKGVLRSVTTEKRDKIFGTEADKSESVAGAVNFSDARTLLFPVRSLRGTFAWATSPLLLHRFQRDLDIILGNNFKVSVPALQNEEKCFVSKKKCVITTDDNRVILEDLDFLAQEDEDTTKWAQVLGEALFPNDEYWQKALIQRLCILSDDVMGFLLSTGTEVVARIALDDETKVVKNGALWYEESLPVESVLYGLLSAVKREFPTEEIFATINRVIEKPLQIGGSATVGRGLCQMRLLNEEA